MTPSEKEKIIEEGFDAIRKVYNLRGDLLEDAGKLEAAKESNRKLSDRVANLEVTINVLNSAIDKKDAELKRLEKNKDAIYDRYLERCHKCDVNEYIMRQMIADNRKKKDEIKRLREELEAEKEHHGCDKCVCSVKKEYELLRKAHIKLCSDYNTLNENNAKLEADFHELRQRLSKLYLYHVHDMLETKDLIAFTDWFKDTFGDFGVNDEEE